MSVLIPRPLPCEGLFDHCHHLRTCAKEQVTAHVDVTPMTTTDPVLSSLVVQMWCSTMQRTSSPNLVAQPRRPDRGGGPVALAVAPTHVSWQLPLEATARLTYDDGLRALKEVGRRVPARAGGR
jgi:hypothetical protein